MLTILYIVEVVVCLMLAFVVLLQKPKEGGLGGIAGGSMGEAVFGADAANILVKTTAWLGAILLANTLIISRVSSQASRNASSIMYKEAQKTQQAAPAPVAPAPVAPAPVAPAPVAPKAK
jgi:preprotein translocase subunit SecG